MPIYEYECQGCKCDYERLVKMNAAAPPCPECNGDQIKRKISATTFTFRGGSPTGSAPARPARPSKPSTAHLPWVTPSGGLASASGQMLLNPDGSAA
jgi:putative FmdB family regulatory protein